MIGEIINRLAPQYNLDPRIVACIVLQESNTDTFANRFEQHIFNRLAPLQRGQLSGWRPGPGAVPSLITEKINRACSWGLMQVLGETARWLCRVANPYLTCLADPEMGIDCGCRVLEFYMRREKGDLNKALACYNAGVATSEAGKAYAAKIMNRFQNREYLKILNDHATI